jgi:hypothetical protein
MKVEIADTFFDSLKRLARHETWWYKTYSAIRWDIPHFFKNIWRFRKELYSHDWWDYRFTLNMLERSLTILEGGMSVKGMEVSETREPKVKQMRRVLELLKNNREDNYVDRAEAELGNLILSDWEFEELENGMSKLVDNDTPKQKAHNRKVFKRGAAIENAEWKELWTIFYGTKNSKKYGPDYDGTDMRGWWD